MRTEANRLFNLGVLMLFLQYFLFFILILYVTNGIARGLFLCYVMNLKVSSHIKISFGGKISRPIVCGESKSLCDAKYFGVQRKSLCDDF